MNNLEAHIWARGNRQCRRCHRIVYAMYKMSAQGVIYHVNRDLNDKAHTNLILVCYNCLHDLTQLILEYPQKYLCEMELITKSKLQSLRDETQEYDIAYRYRKICQHIKTLEEENNILVLPSVDQEHLLCLRVIKAKMEAKDKKGAVNKE